MMQNTVFSGSPSGRFAVRGAAVVPGQFHGEAARPAQALEMELLLDDPARPRGLAFLSGSKGALAQDFRDWLGDLGGNMMIVADQELPTDWIRKYAARLDFCIVDVDFLGDTEEVVDFCLRLRRAAPGLPVILVPSEVHDHDSTAEQMMACDVMLEGPVDRVEFVRGIRAAQRNTRQFRNWRLSANP